MRTTILRACPAMLLCALTAVPALAADRNVTVTGDREPSLTISVGDLDLGSRQGLATLDDRIEAAAAHICLTNAVEPLDKRLARAKCYRTAISGAHRHVERMMAADTATRSRGKSAT